MLLEQAMVEKFFGVKYQNEIHAVMCFAFTNNIPKTVDELDRLSKDAFLQVLIEIKMWVKLQSLTLSGQKKGVEN